MLSAEMNAKHCAFVEEDIGRSSLWLFGRSKNRAPGNSDVMARIKLAASNNFKSVQDPQKLPIAVKSIAAPLSPTTQQTQHSPNRRIKSMSFMVSVDIKVIYF